MAGRGDQVGRIAARFREKNQTVRALVTRPPGSGHPGIHWIRAGGRASGCFLYGKLRVEQHRWHGAQVALTAQFPPARQAATERRLASETHIVPKTACSSAVKRCSIQEDRVEKESARYYQHKGNLGPAQNRYDHGPHTWRRLTCQGHSIGWHSCISLRVGRFTLAAGPREWGGL